MDLSALHHKLPEITSKKRFKASRIFTVEELGLKFSNGSTAIYERIVGGNGAVLVVPFDGTHFYLSSEYACGRHCYSLGFVKGKVDDGESPEQAAGRELQEEIGFGARNISMLRSGVTVAPGMLELCMYLFLAEDLYPAKLEGDEPEPIEIIKATPQEAKELIFDPDSPLKEARAITALMLALHKIGAI
ncbi:MAG: ADP compounds hydrolase NudE [Proteobacteria bacterium]|uniref:ADP compounds hydrolase NudE n=1 Tax=Candidatus Avisuccinivibrio stercorigallinarum TaxID=2840704 RepID=A0A9D9DAT1_9GAMM|nr:ADP compounds hydrolase NudE [Candidatus Avisuccinivibrio stercorigallinarum]